MKNFFKNLKNKISNIVSSVKGRLTARSAKVALANQSGEGYIDTAVKIIIAVVIGGLLLAGLYALFNTTVIPTLTQRITEMFGYTG